MELQTTSQATTVILAALYHESGRTSVAVGATLAHSVDAENAAAGNPAPPVARPFAEYKDLPPQLIAEIQHYY